MRLPAFAAVFLLVFTFLTLGCRTSAPTPTNSSPKSSNKEEPAPTVGESSSKGDKSVRELTSEELAVVNSICQKVLKDYFGNSIVGWSDYTLNRFPEHIFGPPKGENLRASVTLVSAHVPDTAYDSEKELKSKLKELVTKQGASNGGKKYQISDSFVALEPAGDETMVTILPVKVSIF